MPHVSLFLGSSGCSLVWLVFGNLEDVTFLILVVIIGKMYIKKENYICFFPYFCKLCEA